MSTLSQFGSGVKSIQTGYVATNTLTSGTGEEVRYFDVTVSAVANTAKCFVAFSGSANSIGSTTISSYNFSSATFYIPTIKVLNSTTIRIMLSVTVTAGLIGRWTLVEYN